MPGWECAIRGCGATFGDVEALLAHQVTDHEYHECRVCGERTPDGFFAIRHAFTEHSRADYVRAYGGDSDAIRKREALVEDVEETVDADAVRERAGAE